MVSKEKQVMNYLFDGCPSEDTCYDWDDLDIGVLLNFYLFLNTGITQAEVAKDLMLAPISVSRQIKNKKSIIREEWKETLSRYLYQTDLRYLRKQIDVLESIYHKELVSDTKECAFLMIEKYIEEQGLSNQMHVLSNAIDFGMTRLLNETTQKEWIFYFFPNSLSIVSSQDIIDFFQRRNIDYWTGKRIEGVERKIILCGSKENFSKIYNMWDANIRLKIGAKDEEWYLCNVNMEEQIIDAGCQLL